LPSPLRITISSKMIPRFPSSCVANRFRIRQKAIIGSVSWETVPGSNQRTDIPVIRWSSSSRERTTRYDPTARRPTRRCDPYGQGGNPMAYADAERLKPTIHVDWIFEMPEEVEEPRVNNVATALTPPEPAPDFSSATPDSSSSESQFMSAEEVQRTLASMMQDTKATTSASKVFPMRTAAEEVQRVLSSMPLSSTTADTGTPVIPPVVQPPPRALVRSFPHPDFISATRFLHTIAAVAQVQAHYPSLSVERKIIHRHWYTVSTIRCHTKVLDGLSPNDFHLAMVREMLVACFPTEEEFVTHAILTVFCEFF
jgi:pterin-4a-carbinolamine dehydratase